MAWCRCRVPCAMSGRGSVRAEASPAWGKCRFARNAQSRVSVRLASVSSMGSEVIRVGDTAVRFLVTGGDSAGSAAVFEASIEARGRMPAPHSHDGFEETVYGLEGVSSWTVDGTAVDVAPGDALCIRRGAVHHFDNHGDVDAKVLCMITPGL